MQGLYHKTFFRNYLRIFVKARVFVPGKPFQSSLNVCG
jgi:hypothetical protein